MENNPELLNSQGVTSLKKGRYEDAINCFRKAIVLRPGYPDALGNLAVALQNLGKWDEGISCCRQILESQPDSPFALFQIGCCLTGKGLFKEAIEQYKLAVQAKPDFAEAHHNIGCNLQSLGAFNQALPYYQQSLKIRPDFPEAQNNLGLLYQDLGRLEEAEICYRQTLKLRPDFPEPSNNLANLLKDIGCHKESQAFYRRTLSINPDYPEVNSNLLLALHYDPDTENSEIEAAHRNWGERAAAGIENRKTFWDNDRNPLRPLRIGFVSPDFRLNAVAYFLKDVFEAFNSDEVNLFCYANNTRTDELTKRLKNSISGWHEIHSLSDDEVVQLIQDDKIDILVDLAGHAGHNRIMVFAYKPAPIQVTWLGYPNTTGLAAMDYRLTDEIADPPDKPAWHSEELVRLTEGFLCFGEPIASPEILKAPCTANGQVTFGCFNNNAKINHRVIELWSEILKQLPDSRLLLKNDALRSAAVQNLQLQRFQKHGIGPERLELVPRVDSYVDHLALYNKVDIGLDVFPYNGTTTTCEAMWMGVPIVTLRGDRHVGRVGASLLTRVGLEELIAETPAEYVKKTVSLAGNHERISELRHDLRDRMRESALGNPKRFTRTLEKAFREMWLRWLKESEEK